MPSVMAGLVPAIHALFGVRDEDVDARDKRGHDGKSRHLFLNFAGRFSTKAAMPSFWSSVANSE